MEAEGQVHLQYLRLIRQPRLLQQVDDEDEDDDDNGDDDDDDDDDEEEERRRKKKKKNCMGWVGLIFEPFFLSNLSRLVSPFFSLSLFLSLCPFVIVFV